MDTQIVVQLKELNSRITDADLQSTCARRARNRLIYDYFIDHCITIGAEFEIEVVGSSIELSSTAVLYNDEFFNQVFCDGNEFVGSSPDCRYTLNSDKCSCVLDFYEFNDAMELIKNKMLRLVAKSLELLDDDIEEAKEFIEAAKKLKEIVQSR